MIRNLKALGLALVAVFAIGAMSASAASAVDAVSVDGNAWLTGVSTNSKFKILSPETKVECTTSNYLATVKNGETSITAEATYLGKLNETPHGADCTSSSGFGAKVDMNGCDFKLSGETTGSDEAKTDATASLVCPVGKEVQLTDTSGCTIDIHGQTPTTGGVVYTNNKPAAGQLTIDVTATGITYKTTGFACELAGLPAEANNANLTGTIVANGFQHGGGSLSEHKPTEGAATAIEVK